MIPNKNKKSYLVLACTVVFALFLAISPDQAQAATKGPDFGSFLTTMMAYLKGAIILAAAFTFAMGAFLYTTSGGDQKKLGKAKEYFYSAATALAALVIAQVFFSN